MADILRHLANHGSVGLPADHSKRKEIVDYIRQTFPTFVVVVYDGKKENGQPFTGYKGHVPKPE